MQQQIPSSSLSNLVGIFDSCSLRCNTKAAYKQQNKTYSLLCNLINAPDNSPLTENQFCLITILYCLNHKITSLNPFLSATSKLYQQCGWPIPPRGPLFNRVKQGLLNYFAHENFSQPKTAFSLDDLRALRSQLDLSKFADARDWCAYTMAFFGLLRIKEYTNGSLLMKDIILTAPQDRVRICLPFSKTVLHKVEVDIAARSDDLCPQAALCNYLLLVSNKVRQNPHAPLFLERSDGFTPLSDTALLSRLRSLLRRSHPHVNPTQYAGHSFRRGGATALYLAGVPEPVIQLHGRWKSLAVRCYLDKQRSDDDRIAATKLLSAQSQTIPFTITDNIERELDDS